MAKTPNKRLEVVKTQVVWLFSILILGNLFATFSDVLIKLFAKPTGVFQFLFLRQVLLVVALYPFWRRQKVSQKRPGRIKVQVIRSLLNNLGAVTAIIALLYLPLATANVIFYAAPIFTLLLAVWLLKEPFKKHRIIASLIGFLGIAIATRPEYINFAALAAFVTAICVAAFNLSVRWLPKEISMISTMFWTNLFAFPITGAIAVFYWQPIDLDLVILCIGACICILIYQGSCIVAFKQSDAGAIAIAEYSGLVFAAILGWMIFAEPVDGFTVAGISMIVLPIIWQSLKEHKSEKATAETVAD